MTKELNQARVDNKLDNFSFLRAEETRSMLIDSLGSCERILKTPMPLVMAIKVRRFILLFLLVLPLALANLHAYLINPFVSGLVAYALLSLDQIGLDLQNPFSEENLSHLPLQKICEGIRLDVSAIFEEQP